MKGLKKWWKKREKRKANKKKWVEHVIINKGGIPISQTSQKAQIPGLTTTIKPRIRPGSPGKIITTSTPLAPQSRAWTSMIAGEMIHEGDLVSMVGDEITRARDVQVINKLGSIAWTPTTIRGKMKRILRRITGKEQPMNTYMSVHRMPWGPGKIAYEYITRKLEENDLMILFDNPSKPIFKRDNPEMPDVFKYNTRSGPRDLYRYPVMVDYNRDNKYLNVLNIHHLGSHNSTIALSEVPVELFFYDPRSKSNTFTLDRLSLLQINDIFYSKFRRSMKLWRSQYWEKQGNVPVPTVNDLRSLIEDAWKMALDAMMEKEQSEYTVMMNRYHSAVMLTCTDTIAKECMKDQHADAVMASYLSDNTKERDMVIDIINALHYLITDEVSVWDVFPHGYWPLIDAYTPHTLPFTVQVQCAELLSTTTEIGELMSIYCNSAHVYKYPQRNIQAAS